MHSKGIVQGPVCGASQWQFAQAAYLRALLEQGEEDLAEDKGVVKVRCGTCGYAMLFGGEKLGIRVRGQKGGGSSPPR